jgi:hypothetical protein
MNTKTISKGLLLVLMAIVPASIGATDGQVLASGEFEGRSDHVVTGGVSIVQTGDSIAVVLGPDFELDGAPDPKVALGKDGYDSDTLLAPLESNEGEQVYELPASIQAGNYNEVWIWCEKFEVPLGVAYLSVPAAD